MAGTRLDNIRIAGIAAALPGESSEVGEGANALAAEISKISASTGILRRHLSGAGICTSDLCHAAATKLLAEMNWPRESIDVLIFVSQTPDYLLPATACSLHGRLGLARSCAAFDVNLGCSGYVYGLWLAGTLLATGARRVLLLAGDTISRIVSLRIARWHICLATPALRRRSKSLPEPRPCISNWERMGRARTI